MYQGILQSNMPFGAPNGINSRLIGTDVVEQAKLLDAGNIVRTKSPSINNQVAGVSTNKSMYVAPGTSTNEYLVDQKLRNYGIYSKLKNKAIYSVNSLPHANLNSL